VLGFGSGVGSGRGWETCTKHRSWRAGIEV
jgi:hypothetical protein